MSGEQPERFPLVLSTDGVGAPTADLFRRWVEYAHQILAGMTQSSEFPRLRITAVLTDDFTAAVNEVLAGNGQAEYVTERLGGTAVAKTLPRTDEWQDVFIVFDSAIWTPTASGEAGLLGLFMAAHEMTHAFIGRLRATSGAMAGVMLPSRTPIECARSIARVSTEEFIADLVAGKILATAASVTVNGQSRPIHPADLTSLANGYSDQLGLVLDQAVHPGWPDLVQSYREHRIDLDRMWALVVQGTDQVMTLIAHAAAQAVLNESPDPLDETYKDHSGATLYLAPVWRALRGSIGDSVFPMPEEFRTIETRICDAGETALLAMWQFLGLTFDIAADRRFSIQVSEPRR